MSAALAAWMNGQRVGAWRVDRGSHSFTYDPAWLQSPHCRSLSLSLPITAALTRPHPPSRPPGASRWAPHPPPTSSSCHVRYALDTIHTRHWQALAMRHGGPAAWAAMQALVEQVAPKLAAVEAQQPADFPPRCW